MKSSSIFLSVVLFAAAAAYSVETNPVGFISLTVPAASDIALGAPLSRTSEFQGVIKSISGNTITFAGTPAFSASQFVYSSGIQPKTYFLQLDSGTKEGLILPITSNDSSSVTVTIPTGEDLSGISTDQVPVSPYTSGDLVSIIPYWTISTLLPNAIAGTQVFALPTDASGVNLSAITYTFNGTNWLRGSAISNDVCLTEYQGVIVRNNSTTQALSLTITGSVPMTSYRLRIRTLAASTRQDYRFFYNSPIPEIISNVISQSILSPGDQLLYIDNSTTGKNKSSTTLTWNGSNWLQGSNPVTNTFTLQPGCSYLFRKNQTASPSSVVVSSTQSYLQ